MVWKACVFFSKEIDEIGPEKVMNLLWVMNPGPIFLFDGIDVITSSVDYCGQVENFGIFISELKPKLPRFLMPEDFAFKEPFCEFKLKGLFCKFIGLRWRQVLGLLDFLDKIVDSVLTAAEDFFVPFFESISS